MIMQINNIIQGNTLNVLKQMPDESIDCVVTSPPYWGLRTYGTELQIWDSEKNCNHKWQTKNDTLHSGRGDAQKSGKYSMRKAIPDTSIFSEVCSKCHAWRGELGLEPTFELYIKHLMQIFDEIKRILKKTGTCWVNLGDSYAGSGGAGGDYNDGGIKEGQPKFKQGIANAPSKSLCMIPYRFAIGMINHGWILRNIIIWHKPSCMPSSACDRYTVDFEPIFFFTKSQKYFFEQQFEPLSESSLNDARLDKGREEHIGKSAQKQFGCNNTTIKSIGRNARTVWDINFEPFSEAHFACFPTELPRKCIRAGCPKDGIVIDPFCGSGTTCLVAKELGRQWLGIELKLDYVKLANERINGFKRTDWQAQREHMSLKIINN
jgi:site-specific DNA-methyltransferase (adenine-specific)